MEIGNTDRRALELGDIGELGVLEDDETQAASVESGNEFDVLALFDRFQPGVEAS